nr:hypothetical protein [Fimbriiglobus sp.]
HPKLLPSPFGFATRSDARGSVPGIEVPPAERPRLLARERQQYAPAFADYRPGGPAVLAVRDMLTRLQAHGIQPMLLLSPESSEFRGWYGESGDTAMSRLAEGLAGEFGVPLIQARGWIPDDQFADGHHATPAGATTFTDRLAAVLREMGR